MVNIEKIITDLLCEPIAHHLCDSGGAYGYQYERNRENIMKGMNKVGEYTNKETNERSLEVTIPVFDLLTYNLVRNEDAIYKEQRLFYKLENQNINPYHIFEVEEVINETFEKGDVVMRFINTYNYEEFISQTLQFCPFYSDNEYYILLQVHNGCDVRGGYTAPKVFKVKDINYFFSGLKDRRTECNCGLNDYMLYGSKEIYDSCGDRIDESMIYERTYLDTKGNVRCWDCDGVVKGGFIQW